jgi:HPt (histidine-containing phosphotransfer) domain-containing protein
MSSVHYNLDYLQQVFQGNDAMVHRILDSFEAQVPGYLDEMESRWRNGDWQNIHPIAHKARSSISMLGMKPLLEDVLHIERTSRSGLHEGEIGARLKTARASLELALEALRWDRAKRSEKLAQRGQDRPRRGHSSTGLRRA